MEDERLFAIRWLRALASEIGCRTDPDLVTVNSRLNEMTYLTILGPLTVVASIGFIGEARNCWVGYVDSSIVHLNFPRLTHHLAEAIQLNDPKSFNRLEKIFHDKDWAYHDPQTGKFGEN